MHACVEKIYWYFCNNNSVLLEKYLFKATKKALDNVNRCCCDICVVDCDQIFARSDSSSQVFYNIVLHKITRLSAFYQFVLMTYVS